MCEHTNTATSNQATIFRKINENALPGFAFLHPLVIFVAVSRCLKIVAEFKVPSYSCMLSYHSSMLSVILYLYVPKHVFMMDRFCISYRTSICDIPKTDHPITSIYNAEFS